MNHRFWVRGQTVGVMALLALASAGGLSERVTAEATSSTLVVEVSGFHSDKGQLLLRLYNQEEGFPTEPKKALREVKQAIVGGHTTVQLAGLPLGSYAVGCVHDENGDGKLERNFLGVPKEGVGASNDARGRMGPPKWKDARFELKPDGSRIQIHVMY
jgi:uncharacterized protein (DUF2141 family)